VSGRHVQADLVGPGPGGGDGPADGNPAPVGELGTSAVRKKVFGPAHRRAPMLGVPKVALEGEVTGLGAQLFFELVDVAPGGARTTIDDQVTPIKLAGGKFRKNLRLHGISWILKPGHRIELEVTTGSTSYGGPARAPSRLRFRPTPPSRLLRPGGHRPPGASTNLISGRPAGVKESPFLCSDWMSDCFHLRDERKGE
jgi:hypothetical protein